MELFNHLVFLPRCKTAVEAYPFFTTFHHADMAQIPAIVTIFAIECICEDKIVTMDAGDSDNDLVYNMDGFLYAIGAVHPLSLICKKSFITIYADGLTERFGLITFFDSLRASSTLAIHMPEKPSYML